MAKKTKAALILTLAAQAAYLAVWGMKCPFCASQKLEAVTDIGGEGLDAGCEIQCSTCGRVWQDVYRLTCVAAVRGADYTVEEPSFVDRSVPLSAVRRAVTEVMVETTFGHTETVANGVMKKLGEAADKPADTTLDTITVIDISDVESMSINTVNAFSTTFAGELEAKKTFAERVREASGDDEVTDKQIDGLWDEGKFELGSGVIMVVRSS